MIADDFISEKTLTTPDPIELHKTFKKKTTSFFKKKVFKIDRFNKNDHKNHPILGSQDGVPTVVSLYHDHQPGETSTHHTH